MIAIRTNNNDTAQTKQGEINHSFDRLNNAFGTPDVDGNEIKWTMLITVEGLDIETTIKKEGKTFKKDNNEITWTINGFDQRSVFAVND
jgi:hypothetical protein